MAYYSGGSWFSASGQAFATEAEARAADIRGATTAEAPIQPGSAGADLQSLQSLTAPRARPAPTALQPKATPPAAPAATPPASAAPVASNERNPDEQQSQLDYLNQEIVRATETYGPDSPQVQQAYTNLQVYKSQSQGGSSKGPDNADIAKGLLGGAVTTPGLVFGSGSVTGGGEQAAREYRYDAASGQYLATIYRDGNAYTIPVSQSEFQSGGGTGGPAPAGAPAPQASGGEQPYPAIPGMGDIPGAINTKPAPPVAPAKPAPAETPFGGADIFATAPGSLTAPRAQPARGFATGAQMPATNPFNGSAAPGAQPTTGAPQFDRTKVDATLDTLDKATSGLFGIANNQANLAGVQAQSEIDRRALDASRLGQARSGGRRDMAFAERQAIAGNQTSESTMQLANAKAGAEAEIANQALRVEAFKAAGDLGLNQSALELDVEKLNMGAVTDYLGQLFETQRIGLQLDQAEAQRLTNFTRDMALIARDYRQMSLQEQDAVRTDLTQRYGINAQLQGIIKQLDAQPGFWEKAALGAISAGAGVGATLIASDVTVKEAIRDTTDAELGELLSAVKSQTWQYKNPEKHGEGRYLGDMAQDLQKTELGRSMVHEDTDGVLKVNGARLGAAAFSGLGLVFDRLKKLEQAAS